MTTSPDARVAAPAVPPTRAKGQGSGLITTSWTPSRDSTARAVRRSAEPTTTTVLAPELACGWRPRSVAAGTSGSGRPSTGTTRLPPTQPMSSARARSMRTTLVTGSPNGRPAAPTSRHRVVATVRGSSSRNLVPRPAAVSRVMMPPSRSTCSRTTSRPTPRPDSPVTSAAVEKPLRKTRSSTSRSSAWSAASAVSRPRSSALARTLRRVDPGAVVGHLDLEHAFTLGGGDHHRAPGGASRPGRGPRPPPARGRGRCATGG